jgi:iron complex outermembrane recepter protein
MKEHSMSLFLILYPQARGKCPPTNGFAASLNRIFLTGLLFIIGVSSYAQSFRITGIVTEAGNGNAIPGVSVLVKGSSNGTITDIDGKFILDASQDAVLVLSFIGFQKQEVAVGGQSSLSIKLKEDTGQLNEVVITALGVSKEKRQLGYSVTDIAGAKLAATNR